MAITIFDTITLSINGDGSTTSFVLPVYPTPAPIITSFLTSIFVQSTSGAGNLVSAVLSANIDTVTFTFSAGFTGTSYITLGVNKGTLGLPLLAQPVNVTALPPALPTTAITLFYDAGAITVAEGLITAGITKGGVVQAPATAYTVTAGKILHLQSIVADMRSTSGSPNGRVRLRTAASGISIASPIIGVWEFFPQGNGQLDRISQNFNTYDIPAGRQIALSQTGSTAALLLTLTLVGYES